MSKFTFVHKSGIKCPGFFDTPLPLNAPTVWCKNCVFCNLTDRWYAGL